MKLSTKNKWINFINDLYQLKSLYGTVPEIAKKYCLSVRGFTILSDIDIFKYEKRNKRIVYTNSKFHSVDYIIRYLDHYLEIMYRDAKQRTNAKKPVQNDLIDIEVDIPPFMKSAAQEAIYKNTITNLQCDIRRQNAYIMELREDIKRKDIALLQNKKSIFAKIKNIIPWMH